MSLRADSATCAGRAARDESLAAARAAFAEVLLVNAALDLPDGATKDAIHRALAQLGAAASPSTERPGCPYRARTAPAPVRTSANDGGGTTATAGPRRHATLQPRRAFTLGVTAAP